MEFADGVVDCIRIGARRGLSMRSCRRIIGGRFAMRLSRCRWGSNGLCVCVWEWRVELDCLVIYVGFPHLLQIFSFSFFLFSPSIALSFLWWYCGPRLCFL